jgi:murein DD-endopeptidase MepM/ murein hydrolase activator NlpD
VVVKYTLYRHRSVLILAVSLSLVSTHIFGAETVVYDSSAVSKKRIAAPSKRIKSKRTAGKSIRKHSTGGKITIYRVKKGDTLYSIARKHHISVSSIKNINKIDAKKLYIGKKIKLPAQGSIVSKGSTFHWPVSNVSSYSRESKPGIKPIGLTIYTARGTAVRPSAKGKVLRVGYMRGYGKYVMIRHGNKFITVYSYLGKTFVKRGQYVSQGKVIGIIEKNSVHFQLGRSGKQVNPLAYLPAPPNALSVR